MSAPTMPSSSVDISPELLAFNNAHNLMAKAGSMFAICALTVILRCYVRVIILNSFGADEWTMLLAFVSKLLLPRTSKLTILEALAFATFTCYTLEVPHGLGKHLAVIQMDRAAYRQLLKVRDIHMCCVTIGLSVVKISVSFLYLRFTTRWTYRVFLWGIIAFMVAFGIESAGTLVCKNNLGLLVSTNRIQTNTISKIFQCLPVQAGWDMHLRRPPIGTGNATCLSRQVFAQIGLFNSIVNIATDFLLALLPAPMIWQLQMNIRTKISLMVVLSLGLFACVAGIMKSTYNKTILTDPRRFIHDWYSMWNFIELDVGIVAASLPALKPLYTRFLDVAREWTSGQTASRYDDQTPTYDCRIDISDSAKRSRIRKGGIRSSIPEYARSSDTHQGTS
jgi:hypothetical protein